MSYPCHNILIHGTTYAWYLSPQDNFSQTVSSQAACLWSSITGLSIYSRVVQQQYIIQQGPPGRQWWLYYTPWQITCTSSSEMGRRGEQLLGVVTLQMLCVLHDLHLGPVLTHWGRDKMDAISQTTFSNAFSWMKMHKFRLGFHWSFFP